MQSDIYDVQDRTVETRLSDASSFCAKSMCSLVITEIEGQRKNDISKKEGNHKSR